MITKQKLKKFFTISKGDVKEEECEKTFEKTKLFKLTRNNLFIGLLLFTAIVDILVHFNLNFLYIRQILGFLFLVLVPGLLIMLCFKIRSIGFWEYLVYTVGLSVAFIMFAGLAVNWTLPLLNITDQPLSLYPILVCFNIFLIALGITAWYRNKDLEHEFTTPKLDTINNIFFITPMLFPVLAILGAFLLNNHGPNFLTMIMLGGIAVYVLLLIIFRKRLNENIWPWALWMMGLALLFMFSMRSWYISGSDIHVEYQIFQLTNENNIWKLPNFNTSYGAMLSITILPTILNKLIEFNIFFISKLLLQIIFSLSPIILFLLIKMNMNLINIKKNTEIISFLSSFFFISQSQFLIYSGWIRQEIAFVFFGLILLVLFTKQINFILKKVLFIIFGASMIVSHYSTAYIAIALFTLVYILILVYKVYEKRKIQTGKLRPSQKSKFYLTGVLILLLLLFGFLWYSQVTSTADGLVDFVNKSISNFGNALNKDMQQEGGSWIDQINIFYKPQNYVKSIKDYETSIVQEYGTNSNIQTYNVDLTKSYITIAGTKTLSYRISYDFSKKINKFNVFLKKISRLMLLLGILYLFILLINRSINIEFGILTIIMFFSFCLIAFLPFSSINYNMMRLYQQSLFLLAFPTLIGGIFLFKLIRINKQSNFFIALIFILYFLISVGMISYLIGGQEISFNLGNIGAQYEDSYVFASEVSSAEWINESYLQGSPIYADSIASYRLQSFGFFDRNIFNDVLPQAISKNSYVFLSYTNDIQKKGYLPSNNAFLRRLAISYNFPIEFLDNNKNKIYNNGGSEIFK